MLNTDKASCITASVSSEKDWLKKESCPAVTDDPVKVMTNFVPPCGIWIPSKIFDWNFTFKISQLDLGIAADFKKLGYSVICHLFINRLMISSVFDKPVSSSFITRSSAASAATADSTQRERNLTKDFIIVMLACLVMGKTLLQLLAWQKVKKREKVFQLMKYHTIRVPFPYRYVNLMV